MPRTRSLSAREREVVSLLAAGLTNPEIAERLWLSPRTVQSHIERAREKTDTRNRTELAVVAALDGIGLGGEATAGQSLDAATGSA